MRLKQQFLARNDCFRAGVPLRPQGVMVHSTGADNPNVARYVPGDGELGRNTGGNHWDRPGLAKCVHAFLGRFADGGVGTVQTLPWDMRGWHAGGGARGSANNTHIGFELCEDGLTDGAYFAAVYREAVELTAHLCREYGLNPLEEGVILCHAEGHARGVASNHGDVLHWFPKHGKDMDDFRAEVAREMEEADMMNEARVRAIVRDELAALEQERREKPVSPWAGELLAQAMAKGLTDGTRPQDYATRQEVALMVNRAAD